MQRPTFYNFPQAPSLQDYDSCMIKSINYLKKKYPDSTIFKVGGENIKRGISDIDILLLTYSSFNGNHLYLRNLPNKYIRMGILLHEFFAIDIETFVNLNRITSYNLQPLIYSKTQLFPKIHESNEFFDFYKLSYYLVINYPMNFYTWKSENKINVRRTLTKLKKLINFQTLFKNVFDENIEFLPEDFIFKLNELFKNYSIITNEELENRTLELLHQAQEITIEIFKIYEKYSSKYVNLKDEGYLKINGYNIRFVDNWENKTYDNSTYFAPKNLAIFNTIFKRIDPIFLQKIKYSDVQKNIDEFYKVGDILNSYLNFCNISNINQLIVDINFSLKGYNSTKYRMFRLSKKMIKFIKK